MPHVNRSSQVKRSGQHNKTDMHTTSPKSIPRDDLRTAYEGDKNQGEGKGRRLDQNSDKTPVR